MVHTFTALGVHVAVDVNSGAVHVLDKAAYDTLNELIAREGQNPGFDSKPGGLGDSWEELKELYDEWAKTLPPDRTLRISMDGGEYDLEQIVRFLEA